MRFKFSKVSEPGIRRCTQVNTEIGDMVYADTDSRFEIPFRVIPLYQHATNVTWRLVALRRDGDGERVYALDGCVAMIKPVKRWEKATPYNTKPFDVVHSVSTSHLEENTRGPDRWTKVALITNCGKALHVYNSDGTKMNAGNTLYHDRWNTWTVEIVS